ncbi:putative serine/threonine protein kinase [Myriangium duriaei CBS 260.36]|uniref:Serine/threonine protein kinase n=1 Tax=Myriangium duriaei CBS 260.36 TaxID=1168546 RepID=A0A9P4MFR7_9PEZI|nr:putative serine/threonine protein kinase [Myriangium duriaei CBS 260.36]
MVGSRCTWELTSPSAHVEQLQSMPPSPLLRLGQQLRGALDIYKVTEQLSEFVCVGIPSNRSPSSNKVILKSVSGHWRLENERDILKQFQTTIPNLRPLIDEIQDSAAPPTIVLKYLDDDLTAASRKQRLTRQEIKFVAAKVLRGLQGLHENGYVHCDVKPRNILINYGERGPRFSDVELADLGGTVRTDSEYASRGTLTGTSVFRAPEVHLELPWGVAADIWSFGVTLINLIWGLNFHLFEPPPETQEDMYDTMVVAQQHKWFGPFPQSYKDFADADTQEALVGIMSLVPREQLTPFRYISEREISPTDKDFILKIMKLDPRERPSAEALLADSWFREDSKRTVGWYSKEEWAHIRS